MVAVPVRLLQFSVTTKMLCLRSNIYTVTVSGIQGAPGAPGTFGRPGPKGNKGRNIYFINICNSFISCRARCHRNVIITTLFMIMYVDSLQY